MSTKRYARYALNYLATAHIFLAAACWRMNGVYNERIYMADDMDQTRFIANGYALIGAIMLVSGLFILLVVKMQKGKHAA
jgi:hypothetical protein